MKWNWLKVQILIQLTDFNSVNEIGVADIWKTIFALSIIVKELYQYFCKSIEK
jgi:hypothetical protein